MSLGIAKAVTEAVSVGSDHWLIYLPRVKTPGRIGQGKPLLSSATEAAITGRTHDQIDAAHMRLCFDENDVIRNMFRVGA